VFANADNRLWPGQFINARLQVELRRGAITVPSTAVQRSQTNLFVYAVKPDSTVAVTPVTLGPDDGQVAVVTKGLEEGTQVVIAGQSRLRNGAAVTVNPAKPNS
jgi:multidrug efflux system membrane fusion protein